MCTHLRQLEENPNFSKCRGRTGGPRGIQCLSSSAPSAGAGRDGRRYVFCVKVPVGAHGMPFTLSTATSLRFPWNTVVYLTSELQNLSSIGLALQTFVRSLSVHALLKLRRHTAACSTNQQKIGWSTSMHSRKWCSKFSFIVRTILSTVFSPANDESIALRFTHKRMLNNCSHAWNGVYEVFQYLLLITFQNNVTSNSPLDEIPSSLFDCPLQVPSFVRHNVCRQSLCIAILQDKCRRTLPTRLFLKKTVVQIDLWHSVAV